jgi:transposase
MTQRKRRIFTTDFKEQVVMLYINGKPRLEIIKEYDLTSSAFDKWIKQHQTSGSFKEADNRTPEQIELKRALKENKQLKMEVDILKQAALILGRK